MADDARRRYASHARILKHLSLAFIVCTVPWGICANADAATESVVYSFQNNGADGMEPYAAVITGKRVLYGTTAFGGTCTCTREPPYGCGTVFAVDLATGAETVLYSFQNDGEDGEGPNGLIKSGTTLYGTTVIGGTIGAGTVFSLNRKTGAESVLHSFEGAYNDGGGPEAALTNVNGIFYGTTVAGGSHDQGRFTPWIRTPARKR